MDTNTLIFVVLGVILVAAIAFFLLRGSKDEPVDSGAQPDVKDTADSKALEPDSSADHSLSDLKDQVEAARDTELVGAEAAGSELSEESITGREEEASALEAPETSAPAELETAKEPTASKAEEAEQIVSKPASTTAVSEEQVAALRDGLKSTRGGFISRLKSIFSSKKEIDPGLLDEIEEVLITADIGVSTADAILARLREAMEAGVIKDGDAAWAALKEHTYEILAKPGSGGLSISGRTDKTPTVVLVIGVNGVGKTTTIGKLASHFKAQGKKVVLAAGDTFRAAAVLQLEVWGRRVGCEVIKGKADADPGSVIFDAVKQGIELGADVVLADTAGRLHTKSPLMAELEKVGRTAEKALGRPADEVLLVLDATTGQNAGQQAAMFGEALPISGVVLTKLDGTAKGGVILGIVDSHAIPVRYVGVGERVEDLREFEARAFVDALFDGTGE